MSWEGRTITERRWAWKTETDRETVFQAQKIFTNVKNPLDTNVKLVYYLISFTNVKEGSFIFGNYPTFFHDSADSLETAPVKRLPVEDTSVENQEKEVTEWHPKTMRPTPNSVKG